MVQLRDGQSEDRSGWPLAWAGRHPGAALLATLLVVTALLVREPTRPRPDLDQAGDEVPLFI